MFNSIKSQLNKCYNNLILKRNRVSYTNNLLIRGRIMLKTIGNGNIKIGSNVRINSGLRFNPIGGDTNTIIIASGDGKVSIGNYVGISNSSIISHREIIIEDNVMIGGSCKLYDTDFHSLSLDRRMMNPDTDIQTAPICIKHGAFIGAHSVILKGVTIGEKSIIGAGSVVANNIPAREVWAGNPAKFIRKV